MREAEDAVEEGVVGALEEEEGVAQEEEPTVGPRTLSAHDSCRASGAALPRLRREEEKLLLLLTLNEELMLPTPLHWNMNKIRLE